MNIYTKNPVCPKCEGKQITIRWSDITSIWSDVTSINNSNKRHKEHLICKCKCCEYSWTMNPADTQGTDKGECEMKADKNPCLTCEKFDLCHHNLSPCEKAKVWREGFEAYLKGKKACDAIHPVPTKEAHHA